MFTQCILYSLRGCFKGSTVLKECLICHHSISKDWGIFMKNSQLSLKKIYRGEIGGDIYPNDTVPQPKVSLKLHSLKTSGEKSVTKQDQTGPSGSHEWDTYKNRWGKLSIQMSSLQVWFPTARFPRNCTPQRSAVGERIQQLCQSWRWHAVSMSPDRFFCW